MEHLEDVQHPVNCRNMLSVEYLAHDQQRGKKR